jgi:predicted nucleic acid-binding Zn ribbon protein
MENGDSNQNEVNQQSPVDHALEARTTVSRNRICERCGGRIRGGRRQFCSGRCRMQARRERRAATVGRLVSAIEDATTALRRELKTPREGP